MIIVNVPVSIVFNALFSLFYEIIHVRFNDISAIIIMIHDNGKRKQNEHDSNDYKECYHCYLADDRTVKVDYFSH